MSNNQILKLRRSAVPGKIPSTSSLDFGELALNTYDGRAFMKKSGSNGEEIVIIGSGASGSFTGSFFGTASWANAAISSSYALSSSYSFEATSASYALNSISASYSLSSSHANLADLAITSLTASSADNFIVRDTITVSGSISSPSITGSLYGTSSWATNAITASHLTGSQAIVNSLSSSGNISVNNLVVGRPNLIAPFFKDGNIVIGSGSFLNVVSASGATSGSENIAIGDQVFTGTLIGHNNVAIGYKTLHLFTGSNNTAVGAYALSSSVAGRNTAYGQAAAAYLQNGSFNTVVGDASMFNILTGSSNTTLGYASLLNANSGSHNTAIGTIALRDLLTGSFNTVIGSNSGRGIISGSYNTVIGVIATLEPYLNNNIILSDGAGNIRARYSSSIWTLSDSTVGNFTGSLLGTSSWAQNSITASYAPDYLPLTGGTINGNVVVNGTASIAFLNVLYETASVIYSSGSNQFGDAIDDVQTLIGTVVVSGSQQITGSLYANSITGSLQGTASWASNSISSSYAAQSTNAATASNILGGTATYIPFFNTDTSLGNSVMFQVSNSYSTSSIAINEINITTSNPEALYVFQTNPTSINVITGKGNLNNYLQNNIQNTNQGISASSDVVATANNGNESSYYIDMGINSENYAQGFIGGPNDAYLYSIANNLHIGSAATGSQHVGFFVGGEDVEANNKLQLNSDNQHTMSGSLDISGSLTVNNGITSSLFGTASWANNAVSSSNAVTASYSISSSQAQSSSFAITSLTASYLNPLTQSVAVSGSITATSITSSLFGTASWANNAITASYALNAQGSGFPFTGSAIISGSLEVTGSIATTGGITGSLLGTASTALSSSYPIAVTGSTIYSFGTSLLPTNNSIFLGSNSGYNATGSNNSQFIGQQSGQEASGSDLSSFIGYQSGYQAKISRASIFMGYASGRYASTSSFCVYIGIAAGENSKATDSVFIGNYAGSRSNIDIFKTGSVFIGNRVGYDSGADYSVFIGEYTGVDARVANYSNFIGYYSGYLASSASYSTLIGYKAGYNTGQFLNQSIKSNNIIIGTNITLPGGSQDSINIGGLLFGTGSYSTTTGNPFSGSAGGRMGINQPFPLFSLDVSGSGRYESGLTVTGSLVAPNITGSLQGTASWASNSISSSYALSSSNAISSSNAQTASYALNSTSASYALSSSYSGNSLLLNNTGSSIFATTGSNTFIGSQIVTGSLTITGSTTQTGNNSLLGNTILSGSIIISGSLGTNNPTVKIYGDTTHNGYIRFDPVLTNIDQSISASYIYVSGSTNDLYFTQNGNGYNNTTRLRWLEGNLYTGLLNGGLITIVTGSTTFNLSSGSGIIVNLNASLTDNPYPTIQYVNWNNYTNVPLTYLTSSIQSYIGIDSNAQITQQTTPFVDGEYNTKILIGTVLHQNKATVNASITYPNVAYGYKQRSYDFIKAFGPLKLSGYTINTSGSLGLTIGGGTAFADGRNYQVDPNNPSYITDPGTTVSKIFRYYQSGSEFVQDTNGGLGYTVIDPANYNNNGVLTGVSPSTPFTIQRVFWYPNSATKGIVVYYGNKGYTSISEAANNINYETFSEVENTKQNAVYLGAVIVKYNGVFTNPSDYSILPAGIFRSVGGAGGGGSVITTRLVDLTDVGISGPTDGQALVYNGTSTKWENKSFISASISGNAATATTASNALTASYVLNTVSSSYSLSASQAQNAVTASYILNAVSASYALSSSFAVSSSRAVSASAATTAISSSYPIAVNGTTIYSVTNTGNFSTTDSILVGREAGSGSSNSDNSILLGYRSGWRTTNSSYLIAIGSFAASNKSNAGNSVFIGSSTGAISASSAVFIGSGAGADSFASSGSVFLGQSAGSAANFSNGSVCIGRQSGFQITNANNSILIGENVGANTIGNLIGSNNIIIGTNITVNTGRKDAINIGGILFGTGSYSTVSNIAFSGSANGRIGINQPFPLFSLDVSGSGRYENGLVITGSLVSPNITGSLLGTSSWASNAVTASYVLNAVSSSYALSASNANTASYILNAVSSSFATTASYAISASQAANAVTASYVLNAVSSSYSLSASQAQNAVTASYILNAVSASYSLSSSYAVSSSAAVSASRSSTAISASYALTASYSLSSSFALSAASATTSSHTVFAISASQSQIAVTASYSNNFTVANQLTIDATLTDYAVVASSVIGSNNIFNQPTGSYTSAFFKYTITSGSSTRAGEIVAAWNAESTQYYDNSTVDIGDTTAVSSAVSIVTGNVQLNVQTNTSGWRIKSLATFI